MFDLAEWKGAAAAGDPISQMRVGLSELAFDERSGWGGETLSEHLIELLELRERLDAELARTAAAWVGKRAWEADGALSPVAWLTHRAPVAKPDAARLVKAARVVRESPQLAERLRAGETTAAHVRALARVMSPRRRPLLENHEDVLAAEATRLSIEDFTVLARRWAALADDHLTPDAHGEHRARNELYAAEMMDGWFDVKGRLDPVAGAQLLGSLDHLMPPDPADAPGGARTLAERRGDALAELGARHHQGTKLSGNPPALNVVVDVATLAGGDIDLVRGRCELEGVGPITRATLEQLACSATVTRVVMAGESVVLDMGRKVRLATPSQVRAVRARDAGCIFPSCDRPARWCDIHHVDAWSQGGATDVATMCCLCRRHHTLIHNTQWSVDVESDGSFRVTHPARAP